jgi:hypothetical protein
MSWGRETLWSFNLRRGACHVRPIVVGVAFEEVAWHTLGAYVCDVLNAHLVVLRASSQSSVLR